MALKALRNGSTPRLYMELSTVWNRRYVMKWDIIMGVMGPEMFNYCPDEPPIQCYCHGTYTDHGNLNCNI